MHYSAVNFTNLELESAKYKINFLQRINISAFIYISWGFSSKKFIIKENILF